MKAILIIGGILITVTISLLLAALYYATIAYVIVHFIKKFW
jgi:hypothetical protein